MRTQCIEVSMEEPLEVLKGCSCLLGELGKEFSENIYSHNAISLISDLITDAVSRLDDKEIEALRLKA